MNINVYCVRLGKRGKYINFCKEHNVIAIGPSELENLTILDPNLNIRAGDLPFYKKQDIYKKSFIPTTKDLINYNSEDWDINNIDRVRKTIDERSKNLAEQIVKIYKFELLEKVLEKI